MKHLFIINPAAGGRDRTEDVAREAAAAFAGRPDSYELYVTKFPLDATEKIKTEAQSGEPLRVYACGGDGTLNECVNGTAGLAHVAVTHYPGGTGNDFIKTFGGEKERFFDLKQLIDGEIRPIDLISCNGRLSVGVCSVGVDARIGTEVHKYSSLPLISGAGAYIVSTAANFVKGINQRLFVRGCGRSFDGELALVCACNGSWYGGSFNPVPTARPDDGALDFLVVKGVSRLSFIRLVGRYAKGRYDEIPELITHLRGDSLEIKAEGEIVVNVDGEALYASSVRLELIPGGVNFIFPENMEYFKTKIEQSKEKTQKQKVLTENSKLN